MKAALFVVLLLAAWVSPAMGQAARDDLPSAPQGKTWKMVWHDEFDGAKLPDEILADYVPVYDLAAEKQ
jgi:hypothetical protein